MKQERMALWRRIFGCPDRLLAVTFEDGDAVPLTTIRDLYRALIEIDLGGVSNVNASYANFANCLSIHSTLSPDHSEYELAKKVDELKASGNWVDIGDTIDLGAMLEEIIFLIKRDTTYGPDGKPKGPHLNIDASMAKALNNQNKNAGKYVKLVWQGKIKNLGTCGEKDILEEAMKIINEEFE